MKKSLIVFFVLSFSVLACHNEVSPEPKPLPTEFPAPKPTSPPSPTPTPTPTPIDYEYSGPSELQPYVNSFVNVGAVYGQKLDLSDITIQFGDLSQYGSGVIGLCEMGYRKPLITLNESWWNRVDRQQRELLLVHELGHCSLKRPHRTDTVKSRPLSIMYPLIISNSTYLGFKEEYDRELYTYGSELIDEEPVVYICDDLGA